MRGPLVVDAHVAIPERDLAWTSVRASGPGGQNVNKVASKVELRFDLAGTLALDAPTKARLRDLARSRLDAEGALVVVSQLTRDRERNLDDARTKLAELVRQALFKPKARRPTRPTRSSQRARVDDKRRQGERKRGRDPGGDA